VGHREDKEDDEDSQEEADRFELVASACAIRAANAYGETRTCLNGLSVISTCCHRPLSSRCVIDGRRGGCTDPTGALGEHG
jgi:hypothetical protein